MDSKSKKIGISNNLLVGLKAELLRKQDHRKPLPEKAISRFQAKNEVPLGKKSKTKSKRKVERNELSVEELQELEKSRKILEKKSKMYDQMNEDILSMDDSSKLPFLVDFEQKAIDIARDKRANSKSDKSTISASDSDEEVDYVDGLGRSRRCLKKDLFRFKELDKRLINSKPIEPEASTSGEPHLLSQDMKREMERLKWEEEVKELSAKENIHYSDVTFSEIRDHGVGFFNFAKDEQTRLKQMELLKQLREQTKAQRKMFSSAKEKKRTMLEIRLAKIMQRKVVQEAIRTSGLDPRTLIAGMKEEEWTEEVESDEEEGLIGTDVSIDRASDEENVQLLKRDDSWRKDAPVREWDVGKKTFDEDTWLNQRREERFSEFAPTYQDSLAPGSKPGENESVSEGDAEDLVALNLKKLRMLIS